MNTNPGADRPTMKEVTTSTDPGKYLDLISYGVPTDIRLEGGRLFWQPVKEWRAVRPTAETFYQFVDLGTASDRQILRFAKRWGVLGLCKQHLEPMSDPGHRECSPLNPEPSEPPSDYPEEAVVWQKYFASEGEPVSEYRRWARIAQAFLSISQDLDSGQPGNRKDWETLKEERWTLESWSASRPIMGSSDVKHAVAVEKLFIAQWFGRWLQIGNVHLRVTWWDDTDLMVELAGGGLLGAIALQLLEFATQYRIAVCTGCRRTYRRPASKPRPKSGQGHYCENCTKKKVPIARAKHRQNLRRQTARKK